MKIILGIGNPEKKYGKTRHNIGFIILDALCEKYNLSFMPGDGNYYFTGSNINASHFILIKPTTYVNLSGVAVKQVLEQYDISLENLLVVSDDLSLDAGSIRLRRSGGDGGHNGLASIIYELEDNKFPRLRFGIGCNFESGLMSDYVLEKFSEKDLLNLKPKIDSAVSLIEKFIAGGTQLMFDEFSKLPSENKNSQIEDN
ncbi:MAG: aminoacyl-tRNA hydrolase [Bacteroidota bacterium]